jgi:hypothetical protein
MLGPLRAFIVALLLQQLGVLTLWSASVHGHAAAKRQADTHSKRGILKEYATVRRECLDLLQDCAGDCRRKEDEDLDAQDECVRACHRRASEKMAKEGPNMKKGTKEGFLSELMDPQSDYWSEDIPLEEEQGKNGTVKPGAASRKLLAESVLNVWDMSSRVFGRNSVNDRNAREAFRIFQDIKVTRDRAWFDGNNVLFDPSRFDRFEQAARNVADWLERIDNTDSGNRFSTFINDCIKFAGEWTNFLISEVIGLQDRTEIKKRYCNVLDNLYFFDGHTEI